MLGALKKLSLSPDAEESVLNEVTEFLDAELDGKLRIDAYMVQNFADIVALQKHYLNLTLALDPLIVDEIQNIVVEEEK